MNINEMDDFRLLLLKTKNKLLNKSYGSIEDELRVQKDDMADESDHASNLTRHQLVCSLQEMELAKIRKIDRALSKIDCNGYGHCEECGDNISSKRLLNQPWAELCLEHAEELELNDKIHYQKRA